MENYDSVKVSPSGSIFYTLRGQSHRIDGPACEWSDGDKSWYLYGTHLNKKEFLLQTGKIGDEMKEGPEESKRYAVICEEADVFYVVDTLSDAILKIEQILFDHNVTKEDIVVFHDVPKKVHIKYDFI